MYIELSALVRKGRKAQFRKFELVPLFGDFTGEIDAKVDAYSEIEKIIRFNRYPRGSFVIAEAFADEREQIFEVKPRACLSRLRGGFSLTKRRINPVRKILDGRNYFVKLRSYCKAVAVIRVDFAAGVFDEQILLSAVLCAEREFNSQRGNVEVVDAYINLSVILLTAERKFQIELLTLRRKGF